jgi:hypothetical protein
VPVQIFAFVNVSGPRDVGEAAKLAVFAAGPDNDNLTYAFDCDNNETYETAGSAFGKVGIGMCTFTTGGVHTVGVQVCDVGLAGCVTETTEVSVTQVLTVALCAHRYTGAVSAAPASGVCPSGTVLLVLPSAQSVTFCTNVYTGALLWSPRGTCPTGYRAHVVPDNGPLNYCQNIYTGKLRYSWNGQCSTGERAGVIPA